MYFWFKYVTLALVSIMCIVAFYLNVKDSKSRIINDNIIIKVYHQAIILLDKYWLVALLAIFAVFCFTRFYALDIVPAGVHVDEIGYWYDAENLAKYGTDRMGSRYPWLPASYGDGHNPCYAYMCMIMLKFFPFSVKLMRAVMGISAIPCFFASFGIIFQLYENRRFALLGPVIVTITPYIFAANRWGLNANQMMYVGAVILYFLIRALKYGKVRDYIFTGVFLGISLLTYHLSYIMMPFFFVVVFVYLIIVKEFKWKNALATFIPFAVIGTPTFLEQLVNLGIINPFYFLGSDYPRLTVYRVGEIAPINLIKNIGNIITLVFGDNEYNYNSVREFGTLHWASIPLLLVGMIIGFIVLIRSVKNRKSNLLAPVILYAISIYVGFISVIGCNAYKANAIYIAFVVFIVVGIRYISGYSLSECIIKNDNSVVTEQPDSTSPDVSLVVRKSFVVITLFTLALSFLLYTEFYFRRMNYTYGFLSLFITSATGDMVKYEESMYNPDGNKNVYMELNYENREFSDWMIALYTEMEPQVFTDYDMTKLNTEEDKKNSLMMNHFCFAFPEEFDENEDAVYILGYNWDHISTYLMEVGFSCDTTFPGYKILYKP